MLAGPEVGGAKQREFFVVVQNKIPGTHMESTAVTQGSEVRNSNSVSVVREQERLY